MVPPPLPGRRARVLAVVALAIFLWPSLAAAATYRCRVTVKTKAGAVLVDKEVEVEPWFFQTAEGVAYGKAVPPDLRSQMQGADVSVYCWEIKKPKLFGIIPVVYTYPSDSLKGVTLAYAVPVGAGGVASADIQQTSGGPAPTAAASLQYAVVGEASFTKADFSSAMVFAGGVRVGKPLQSGVDVFGQVMMGVTRFSGESDFTLKPEVGVVFPLKDKPFALTAVVGFPIIFFTGVHERGFEFGGGIVLPGRRIR